MAYGLATYIDDNDVLLTTKPFNPVWSVKFTNMGTQTVNLTIPPGEGTIVFTNSVDRPQIDAMYSGSELGTAGEVTIKGDTVTMNFTSVSAGVSEVYYTFYRYRG